MKETIPTTVTFAPRLPADQIPEAGDPSAPRRVCPTVAQYVGASAPPPPDPVKGPARKQTSQELHKKYLAPRKEELKQENSERKRMKTALTKHKERCPMVEGERNRLREELEKAEREMSRLRKLNRELGGTEEEPVEEMVEDQAEKEDENQEQSYSNSTNPEPNQSSSSSAPNRQIAAVSDTGSAGIDSGSVAPDAESARAIRAAERTQRLAGESIAQGKKTVGKKQGKGKGRMLGENAADEVSSAKAMEEGDETERPLKRNESTDPACSKGTSIEHVLIGLARLSSQMVGDSALVPENLPRTPSPSPSSTKNGSRNGNTPFTPVPLKSESVNGDTSSSLNISPPNTLNFDDWDNDASASGAHAQFDTPGGSRVGSVDDTEESGEAEEVKEEEVENSDNSVLSCSEDQAEA